MFTNIQTNDDLNNLSKVKPRVIEIASNERLLAKDYPYHDIFLAKGRLELHRRGAVAQLIQSDNKWNLDAKVFKQVDSNAYAHCIVDCQFLLLPKKNHDDRSHYGKVIKTERLFDEVMNKRKTKITTPKNIVEIEIKSLPRDQFETPFQWETSNEKNNIKVVENNHTVQSKVTEVCVIDLDKVLDKTIIITPKVSNSLHQKINEIHKVLGKKMTTKINNTISATLNKLDNLVKKIDSESAIEKQQQNKKIVNNLFDEIGNWVLSEKMMPSKNGLYYISNGTDVITAYFNKSRNIFHKNQDIELVFWSTNLVDIKKEICSAIVENL